MEVKAIKNVYGGKELLFKNGDTYPTSVYKCLLSAQTLKGKPYPEGYEVIANDGNENWNKDEWFRIHFEILE